MEHLLTVWRVQFGNIIRFEAFVTSAPVEPLSKTWVDAIQIPNFIFPNLFNPVRGQYIRAYNSAKRFGI
jgi:hypothetical protein